jgi:predicted kinase
MNQETVTYPCGCSATGIAPIPRYCPDHPSQEDHTPFTPGELDGFLAQLDTVLKARENESTDSILTLLRQARTNLGRLRSPALSPPQAPQEQEKFIRELEKDAQAELDEAANWRRTQGEGWERSDGLHRTLALVYHNIVKRLKAIQASALSPHTPTDNGCRVASLSNLSRGTIAPPADRWQGEVNMRTLILTVGLPRSGKTTWARQQGHPIVNPDSIRLALHGQRFILEAEPMVWAMARYMVKALFLAGHDTVILDATNTSKKRRAEWMCDNNFGWWVKYQQIPTSEAECLERADASHDEEIKPIIKKMAACFEPLEDYETDPKYGGFMPDLSPHQPTSKED